MLREAAKPGSTSHQSRKIFTEHEPGQKEFGREFDHFGNVLNNVWRSRSTGLFAIDYRRVLGAVRLLRCSARTTERGLWPENLGFDRARNGQAAGHLLVFHRGRVELDALRDGSERTDRKRHLTSLRAIRACNRNSPVRLPVLIWLASLASTQANCRHTAARAPIFFFRTLYTRARPPAEVARNICVKP